MKCTEYSKKADSFHLCIKENCMTLQQKKKKKKKKKGTTVMPTVDTPEFSPSFLLLPSNLTKSSFPPAAAAASYSGEGPCT